jgi:hypothetical protein
MSSPAGSSEALAFAAAGATVLKSGYGPWVGAILLALVMVGIFYYLLTRTFARENVMTGAMGLNSNQQGLIVILEDKVGRLVTRVERLEGVQSRYFALKSAILAADGECGDKCKVKKAIRDLGD